MMNTRSDKNSITDDEADAVEASLMEHAAWLHHADVHKDTLSEHQHQQIMDYVDGNASASERANIQSLIQNNPAAQKAALHYTSHRADMAQQVPPQSATPVETSASDSLMSKLSHALFGWMDKRAPLWALAPATALATFVIVTSVQFMQTHPAQKLHVANYQDNPVIQFRSQNSLPGIGFFTQSENTTAPYTDIKVTAVSDGKSGNSQLQIQWPAIADAIEYSMRLQLFDKGKKTTIGEQRTKDNHTSFETDKLAVGKRYEWVLTGNTSDNRTFYTTGGFVVQPEQTP